MTWNASFARPLLLPLSLTAALLLGSPSPAFAARLLTVEVQRDGQKILVTAYSDDGQPNTVTVWRYLAEEPLWASSAQIEPDSADPRNAVLEGNLQILLMHGGNPLARASVNRLKVTRSSSDTDRWHLPADEVERTASLAGLGPAEPPSSSTTTVIILGSVAFVVLVGLLTATGLWLRRRNREATEAR